MLFIWPDVLVYIPPRLNCTDPVQPLILATQIEIPTYIALFTKWIRSISYFCFLSKTDKNRYIGSFNEQYLHCVVLRYIDALIREIAALKIFLWVLWLFGDFRDRSIFRIKLEYLKSCVSCLSDKISS